MYYFFFNQNKSTLEGTVGHKAFVVSNAERNAMRQILTLNFANGFIINKQSYFIAVFFITV